MVLALSTQDAVFNAVLGLAMVIGWAALFAVWWFVFRKAPRDGSDAPYVVDADQPPTAATADSMASSRASIASEPADGR